MTQDNHAKQLVVKKLEALIKQNDPANSRPLKHGQLSNWCLKVKADDIANIYTATYENNSAGVLAAYHLAGQLETSGLVERTHANSVDLEGAKQAYETILIDSTTTRRVGDNVVIGTAFNDDDKLEVTFRTNKVPQEILQALNSLPKDRQR